MLTVQTLTLQYVDKDFPIQPVGRKTSATLDTFITQVLM